MSMVARQSHSFVEITQCRVLTLWPELFPVDPHISSLGLVAFLQEVLKLVRGRADMIHPVTE
jgi:hypothetical protein